MPEERGDRDATASDAVSGGGAAEGAQPPRPGHRVSRRALLIGAGAAVAAGAAGVPIAASLWPRPPVEAMRRAVPFTIAHRGGSADWPEMSAYAYGRSVSFGVNALEMSVSRTADGVWCGVHDGTLDRTSGTTGFNVAEHTWDEVRRHLVDPPPGHPDQPSRPYWRLADLIDRYHSSHALWIDPKAVAQRFYAELMSVLVGSVPKPAEVFVAKSGAENGPWAELAEGHGIESWGFYYGRQLDADPDFFARTQRPWTMLGLDVGASAAHWRSFTADGRPVVAHVLTTDAARRTALRRGAAGLMIAGVEEILG